MTKLVDIDVEIRHETDKAYLIWNGREDKDGNPIEIWIPKFCCQYDDNGTITMEEWLASDKGLI